MTFKNLDYCLHGAKEGGREGYRQRVREREGNRERGGEWEKEKYANILFDEVWPHRSLKVTKIHPIFVLTQPFP